jgi:hypothetical protein
MAANNMIDQFKNFDDLQAFAKAQQKTLVELTKKNKNYEEEIKHLKKLVEGAVPLLNVNPKPVDFSTNDEEAIAREQLFRLKDLSHERELSLEEAKRVEIFSKILVAVKNKPKTINGNSRELSENDLLTLLGSTKNDNDTTGI